MFKTKGFILCYVLGSINGFHLCLLRRLSHIKWQDLVSNTEGLQPDGVLSIPSMLIQRRFRWHGQVFLIAPQRQPREILGGELCHSARLAGRPLLLFKDTIQRDLKAVFMNATS